MQKLKMPNLEMHEKCSGNIAELQQKYSESADVHQHATETHQTRITNAVDMQRTRSRHATEMQ